MRSNKFCLSLCRSQHNMTNQIYELMIVKTQRCIYNKHVSPGNSLSCKYMYPHERISTLCLNYLAMQLIRLAMLFLVSRLRFAHFNVLKSYKSFINYKSVNLISKILIIIIHIGLLVAKIKSCIPRAL